MGQMRRIGLCGPLDGGANAGAGGAQKREALGRHFGGKIGLDHSRSMATGRFSCRRTRFLFGSSHAGRLKSVCRRGPTRGGRGAAAPIPAPFSGPVRHFAMTIRTLTILTAWAFVIAISGPLAAKEFLSPSDAERLGMTEAWHRQVGSLRGAEGIIDIQVWVNKSVQLEYIEVVLKGGGEPPAVVERFPTHRLGRNGRPIGKRESERLAKLSVLLLKRRGIDAEIRSTTIDQVRLHVLTEDGNVSAYDGETGQVLWSIRVGQPRLGYSSMGINDRFVTFTNGTRFHQIVAMESEVLDEAGVEVTLPAGRPLPSVNIDRLPVHGVVNAADRAIFTLHRGGIESHTLGGPDPDPAFEMFHGKPLSKPATFPNSGLVMWPTDQQLVYAMDVRYDPVTLFRLPIEGNAIGGITGASDKRFFFGSTGGRIYGVRATATGEVLWNQSIGDPIYRAPFLSGERMWVSTTYGSLHCLSATDGRLLWPRPTNDMDHVFAHVGNRLVGRDREHHLVVLDADSGAALMRSREFFVERLVVNQDTDRAYLVGRGGMVQCLRPSDSEMPVFLREIPAAETAEGSESEPASGDPAGTRQPVDPFDAGGQPTVDPFDAGGQPPADPFGGGADPFGGDDPFGAGGDPFGND
ncbi:MAG: hypothetical protein EA381_19225 [Planctomycetaceae bacterium]|nr:MAG: hypothetical protein EA381_19225 [Planctomycetaceae bacterium]